MKTKMSLSVLLVIFGVVVISTSCGNSKRNGVWEIIIKKNIYALEFSEENSSYDVQASMKKMNGTVITISELQKIIQENSQQKVKHAVVYNKKGEFSKQASAVLTKISNVKLDSTEQYAPFFIRTKKGLVNNGIQDYNPMKAEYGDFWKGTGTGYLIIKKGK